MVNNNGYLWIDILNLTLPSGFEARANTIARETVRQLQAVNLHRSAQFASLTLPPVTLHGGESDGVIARRIAAAIAQQITSPAAGVARPAITGGGDRHAD